jgi:hypothetical protein
MARRSGESSAERSVAGRDKLNGAVLDALGYERTGAVFSVVSFSLASACKITMSSVAPLLSSMVRIVRRGISFLDTITPTTLM